ncbi:hypothetical protein NLO56_24595, partial [Escherichia coli]|nr:hypothetical protein [Escherichia coli]
MIDQLPSRTAVSFQQRRFRFIHLNRKAGGTSKRHITRTVLAVPEGNDTFFVQADQAEQHVSAARLDA